MKIFFKPLQILSIVSLLFLVVCTFSCKKREPTPPEINIVKKWAVEKVIYKSYNLSGVLLSEFNDTEISHLEFTADNKALFYYIEPSPGLDPDTGSYTFDKPTQIVSISNTLEEEFNYKFKISNYSAAGLTLTTSETILDNNDTEKLVIEITLKQ